MMASPDPLSGKQSAINMYVTGPCPQPYIHKIKNIPVIQTIKTKLFFSKPENKAKVTFTVAAVR